MFEPTAEAVAQQHEHPRVVRLRSCHGHRRSHGDNDRPRLRVETVGAARAALRLDRTKTYCTDTLEDKTAGYRIKAHRPARQPRKGDPLDRVFDLFRYRLCMAVHKRARARAHLLCWAVFLCNTKPRVHIRRNERREHLRTRHHFHDWKQNHHPALHHHRLCVAVWHNFNDQKSHETADPTITHHSRRSNNNLFGRQGSFRQQLRERN